jgi:hypothetical protein
MHQREKFLAFGCEELLLARGSVIDAVEGERELFGLVFGARDFDYCQGTPFCDAVRMHNDVLFQLVFEQRTDSGNNTD